MTRKKFMSVLGFVISVIWGWVVLSAPIFSRLLTTEYIRWDVDPRDAETYPVPILGILIAACGVSIVVMWIYIYEQKD